MADQRFTRAHRILKRPIFLSIYENGRRAHGRLGVVFCRRRDDDGPWRLGITATRKTGGAVVRNRLRRRAREFFRRRSERLPAGWDFVVNLKPGAGEARWEEFARDLDGALRRLGFGASMDEARGGEAPEGVATDVRDGGAGDDR
ncbi:MAG: ribonuclease P protein component [bacterium]|nr:ribonuclease P protein component [bacterium]